MSKNTKTLNSASPEQGVKRQVVLPFLKAVEIAFKSLRVRFFRSLITALSLVLAVSFLSFVRVGTDVADGLLATGDPAVREKLIRSGYDLEPDDVAVASSPKQRWIVVLSLLVCVVGIVNAQLMSVTERFREIGTMKCLGALDRFILLLFVLESAMQGIAGAVVGSLAGAFFSMVNAGLTFGVEALRHLPWTQVVESLAFATLAGFLLSVLGVLYPAIVAARMQPVEAMRVEQ